MKEKRFALIVPIYLSYNLFFEDLCQKMVDKGWQVWVFTSLLEKKNYTQNGIHMIHLDMPRQFEIVKYFKCAFVFKKYINQIQPSIIQAHFQPAALVVFLSNTLDKATSFTTSHGLIFNTKSSRLKSYFFRKIEVIIYKKFSKLWVLTNLDKDAVMKYMSNVDVYPTKGLGCNLNKFHPSNFSQDQKNNLSLKLGIASDDFVFIFCGRLTNFKGIDITYRAFCEIQKKYKKVKLIILGDFDQVHPSGLTPSEISDLKQNKNINHIGFTNDVSSYLSISNVLVFPSNREGMPVNLMEAICMGVPIITYNSRGNVDIVSDGYGLLIDNRTVESFALAMEKMMNDKTLYENIKSNQLRDRYLFDRNLYFDYQIKIYDECLNK